jgi:hypothetical protein
MTETEIRNKPKSIIAYILSHFRVAEETEINGDYSVLIITGILIH